MKGAEFQHYLASAQAHTQDYLDRLLYDGHTPRVPPGLVDAARYSLSNGGKRVRPLLVLAAAQAVDEHIDPEKVEYPGAAIEMLHTYSLVHDDLPAMDDDDLRRGQPSLHKAYDEGTAILVGDGLQARAFELLATAPGCSAEQRSRMVAIVAAAAGPAGMAGGQYIDISATGSSLDQEGLSDMHRMKTGALIRASLALGGITAGANPAQMDALDQYGDRIGLAFQVVDDILDVEGDSDSLGKTSGKDAEANKPTYVKLLGLDSAKEEAGRLLAEALAALEPLGQPADPLAHLARYIVERDR